MKWPPEWREGVTAGCWSTPLALTKTTNKVVAMAKRSLGDRHCTINRHIHFMCNPSSIDGCSAQSLIKLVAGDTTVGWYTSRLRKNGVSAAIRRQLPSTGHNDGRKTITGTY